MRVTANMSADASVYNIQQGRNRIDRLQEVITSGQNINRPSDDPISSRLLLDISDKLKSFDQYSANIIKAKSWMQFTDTALSGMNEVIRNTKRVMNNFYNGSNDPIQRQSVNDQLKDLKKQFIDLANTQYGDQFIFGGANNTVPPFNYLNNVYAGDGTERKIEIAQSTTQLISTDGDRLVNGIGGNPSYGTTDILKAFDDLMTAVGDSVTPSNTAAITAARPLMDAASSQIMNAINTNLSRMTRVDSMAKLNETNKETLNTIVGNIQNPDMIKLGVQLNTEKNAFEASLSATAKLVQMSLLDFLR